MLITYRRFHYVVSITGGFYNDTLTGVCLNLDLDNTIYVTSPELEPDALWSYSENNNNNILGLLFVNVVYSHKFNLLTFYKDATDVMGKCQFNDIWLDVWPWVWKTGDTHTAGCAVCLKDIDVAAMGESALKSHAKSKKHLSLSKLTSDIHSVCEHSTASSSNN